MAYEIIDPFINRPKIIRLKNLSIDEKKIVSHIFSLYWKYDRIRKTKLQQCEKCGDYVMLGKKLNSKS